MFGNLINRYDWFTLVEKMKRAPWRTASKLAGRLTRSKKGNVEKAWGYTQKPPRSWSDIPEVRERWNLLVSGDAKVDYYEHLARKYLRDRDQLEALSLGCGTGQRERRWASLGKFKNIDAYDLSAPRIQYATDLAKQEGYDDTINYRVGDIYTTELRDDSYDVVLGEQSLHHFWSLDKLFARIDRCLRYDGYFFVNEFVGPDRFQWTDKQLGIINGLLAEFPPKYREVWGENSIRRKAFRPSKLRMALIDPSEAVESSRILPLLHVHFNVLETIPYGGTILQMLFNGIAHNFISGDAMSQRLLKMCFEAEDQLLESGEIPSDFVVAVCRKRANK